MNARYIQFRLGEMHSVARKPSIPGVQSPILLVTQKWRSFVGVLSLGIRNVVVKHIGNTLGIGWTDGVEEFWAYGMI